MLLPVCSFISYDFVYMIAIVNPREKYFVKACNTTYITSTDIYSYYGTPAYVCFRVLQKYYQHFCLHKFSHTSPS